MMKMPRYYDRQGRPLVNALAWAKLEEEGGLDYKSVAATTLSDGTWVSTVWLGADHQYGDGPPLIFETMVFPREGNWSEMECERYSTEAQAREGHARMVAKYSAMDLQP